ncbi:MAG: hypothetical protein Q9216_000175 [Gyalolechia sp. 2 TL-2023]
MAAGYAIPASVHDVDHVSLLDRKNVAQRFPIEAGPTKGMNGGSITQEDRTTSQLSQSHSHFHNPPPQISDHQSEADNEDLDSTPELPPPDFTSIKSNSSRPKSMQRRISVGLPTHLRLQGKGYGVPVARRPNLAPTTDHAARKWMTFSEAFSSVLVALSFVFVSIFHDGLAVRLQDIDQLPVGKPLKNPHGELQISPWNAYLPMPTLVVTFALTAATLVLGGAVGKAQMSLATNDQSKKSLKSSDQQPPGSSRTITSNAQKVIRRTLCVALPCYAASSLGGARVALIMLVALFSKIVTLEYGEFTLADKKRWKQLLEYRRWTLLSVLAQAIFDLVGNASSSRIAGYTTGYLALMVSIMALPPPFPSINRGNPAYTANNQLTRFLLETFQHRALLHSILVEKDSRRIFYFMRFVTDVIGYMKVSLQNSSLNFTFMLVQFFYGIATGSLGLLSDSIHMFFDCVALVVGLCAAVMSKWPPSPRFPYGYSKIDTLAGFANGIFLMLISLEIVYEAVERLVEGSEMQRIGELLTVSTLGLLVNLVGVTAFGHAHHGHSHNDHSHHGHSHHENTGHHHGHADDSRCHENHDHHHPESRHSAVQDLDHQHEHEAQPNISPSPSPYTSVPATPSKPVHSHVHAYEAAPHHHHGHDNENMQGIYLHVLADTLGSVAVVVSTLLIHFYGWSGFDPLASCLIAILIFASAIPLVKSTAKKLLLTIPGDVEFDLREVLAGVSALKGVAGYAAPKFWLDGGEDRKVIGVIHVTAGKGVDMEDLKNRVVDFLGSKNMDVIVQAEREGVNRCWCKAKAG